MPYENQKKLEDIRQFIFNVSLEIRKMAQIVGRLNLKTKKPFITPVLVS